MIWYTILNVNDSRFALGLCVEQRFRVLNYKRPPETNRRH